MLDDEELEDDYWNSLEEDDEEDLDSLDEDRDKLEENDAERESFIRENGLYGDDELYDANDSGEDSYQESGFDEY